MKYTTEENSLFTDNSLSCSNMSKLELPPLVVVMVNLAEEHFIW